MDLKSLEIKISRSENLPVLPQVVAQVVKLADDPNASPKSMERIIERDPGITAKVLRVANSASYGGTHVTSIGRALSVLGLNQIKSLCLAVAYQQMIAGKQISQRFSKLELWRHSLAVATTARVLARIKMPLRAEELYVSGIMHDVGILVLDRFCPLELDKVMELSLDVGLPLPEAIKQVFGYDQAEVGGMLVQKWGLSSTIVSSVKNHLTLPVSDPHYHATCFINIADTIAHRCGFTNNSLGACTTFDPTALEEVGLPEEQLDVIQNVVVAEVLKAQEAFQIK